MILTLLRLLPKNLLSRFTGKLMSIESPVWLVRVMKIWFAGHYMIRLDEAEKEFDEYRSINALFTRRLKSGIRPIVGDLVHPADSKIAQAGVLEAGQLLQAKGWSYSASDLIGNNDLASQLKNGSYFTYYLCPTDYHRVHSPVDGKVVNIRHIPGTLWPVNPGSVRGIESLFLKNERMVFEIETVFGVMAVVMVGATNVGKITTSLGSAWQTNLPEKLLVREESVSADINAGQELGIFHMGSTVICLWPSSAGIDKFSIGSNVLYGQALRGT